MKKIIYLLLIFSVNLGLSVVITRDVGGMVATYTGWKGEMLVTPSAKDNAWNIRLYDVPEYYDNKTDVTLIIRARNRRTRDNTLIDNIISDGALHTLQIDFSAGNGVAGCVRNIQVNGKVENLIIKGGDIGDGDGMDGYVRINGHVKKLFVKGRKYNVINSDGREFWGGNIWADIVVTGGIGGIELKGGFLHGYGQKGTYGKIISSGVMNMEKLSVKGVHFKALDGTKRLYGGSISSEIKTHQNKITLLRVKGGTIYGSQIYAREIDNLKINGQQRKDGEPFFTYDQQGIFNSRIGTVGDTNIFYSKLNKINIKNGNIINTKISSMGRMAHLDIKGKQEDGFGNFLNSQIRSGYVGAMSENTAPYFWVDTNIVTVALNEAIVLPFVVTNGTPDELLTIRLHHRGPAFSGVISNYLGQTFSGTNLWQTTDNVVSGMFRWVASDCPAGVYTNLTLRVLDSGVPRKYTSVQVKLRVNSGGPVVATPTLPYNTDKDRNFTISATYTGNIKNIRVDGNMTNSFFLSGIKEGNSGGWEKASYLGKIGTLNVKGKCVNSVFCSRKDFVNNNTGFDYENNQVWINGTREQD